MGCSAALEVDPGFQGKDFNICAQSDLPWDLQPWSWRTAEDHPHHWICCSSGEVFVQPTESAGRRFQPLLDATHLSGTHSRDCPSVSMCPTGWQHPYLPSKHDASVPVCPKSCTSLSPLGTTILGHQIPLQALIEEIIQKHPLPGNIPMQECYYLHKYLLLI